LLSKFPADGVYKRSLRENSFWHGVNWQIVQVAVKLAPHVINPSTFDLDGNLWNSQLPGNLFVRRDCSHP
jgi:hypothetical protein